MGKCCFPLPRATCLVVAHVLALCWYVRVLPCLWCTAGPPGPREATASIPVQLICAGYAGNRAWGGGRVTVTVTVTVTWLWRTFLRCAGTCVCCRAFGAPLGPGGPVVHQRHGNTHTYQHNARTCAAAKQVARGRGKQHLPIRVVQKLRYSSNQAN